MLNKHLNISITERGLSNNFERIIKVDKALIKKTPCGRVEIWFVILNMTKLFQSCYLHINFPDICQ